MQCQKCGSKALVRDSREENFIRKRRYSCPNCDAFIYTTETIVYSYTPTKQELELFKKRRSMNKNEEMKVDPRYWRF